ncbi:DNA helicase RecQ [Clostridium botulinum]|uniref:DNA helicase RecQ n=1 Tax=Clostridium TaxID=1485 RepID=UPI0013FC4A81|nr:MULTISPECIES: DNA helicase RecQ [Clostridium]MCS6132431.1 DNA helicase RecQ [Clostridium botulinum]NFL46799.1 DNA helicase RecQ [Clostridium botulinum]NFL90063.1 DNA helicase RecQ [Clostridium botulinum]
MKSKELELLEKYYGYKSFRKGQENIISNIIDGNDVLAIMPTGGGKSICYQVPALIFEGLTIVISPLISLMKDQVDALKDMGINGEFINSSISSAEENRVIDNIRNGQCKILYVAPERLESLNFLNVISECSVSQIAIDEAHCISQWGHDFRTSYTKVSGFIKLLKTRPIITAFTATASEEVREDIIRLLNLNKPKIFITGFDRENLLINVIKSGDKKSYLHNYINNNKESSGVIYAATRKEVDKIHEELSHNGFSITKYHAGLSENDRKQNQEDFIYDRSNIMVATNAFGMGIDKPNIRFVVHYNMPKNIEGYYQEIGRAGRDGEKSECILLFSPQDVQIQKYLIEQSIENIDRKNNQYKKLNEMTDFVYSNECYRKYILDYFGEVYDHNCNNCSNCLNEGELVDKTIDAQKVLSCIYRMKNKFGSGMLVDVLRGSKNKKVIQFNFNELSTYGIMKDYSNDELKNFINTLISHRYISVVNGTYPVLGLNQRSMSVLKSEEKVVFKEFKIEKKAREDNELYSILKEIRKEISVENGVPPYVIFGDATLKEMTVKYPVNKEQMLNISGVGEIKYKKYGEIFENEIKKFIKENNVEISNEINEKEEVKMESIHLDINTNEELFNKLDEIRHEFAKKENTIPKMIISKNSLKEISGRYPINIDELKDISGIGPKKISLYGEKLILAVNDYIAQNNIEIKWVNRKKRKVIIDGEDREDNEIAIDMLKDGKKLNEICDEIEVSISTILGYVTDYIKEFGESNFDLNLEDFYNEEEEDIIGDVCEKIGYEKISAIKKQLPPYIKYETIRAVILKKYFLR